MGATRQTRALTRVLAMSGIIVAVCAISSCGRSEARQPEIHYSGAYRRRKWITARTLR